MARIEVRTWAKTLKILKKNPNEIHVMLYPRCSGATCLNAEIKGLVNTLSDFSLKSEDILKIILK